MMPAPTGDVRLAPDLTARWLLSLLPAPAGTARELLTGDRDVRQGHLNGGGRSRRLELLAGNGRSLRLEIAGAGSAPAVSVGAGTATVFEGRLFYRAELLAALSLPASGEGDAELVRRAFERWGAAAVDRLRGEYVCCFWDVQRRTLFAVRDRTGVYPLFFRYRSGSVELSTSPSLVAAAAGKPEVDRNVVAALVARVAPDLSETCYRGVERLPAGHLLAIDAAGRRCERYWRLTPIGRGAGWMSAEEADTFPQLLERVVGRAQGAERAGIFLSGGLDSVSVAVAAEAYARSEATARPLALSFFFPERMREADVQRAVAARLGFEQVTLEYEEAAGARGMLREALALSATLEAPLQNIWLPGYLRLGRAGVERGIGSILTGRGGDEWLTMFPVVAADLLRSFEVRELFAHTVAAVRASRVHSYRALRSTLWDSGARELLRATRAALVARLAKGAQARRVTASLQRRRQRSPWLLPDPALRRVIDRRLRVRLEEGLREPGLPRDGFRHEVIAGMLDNPLFAPSFEESYEQSRLAGAMHHDIYWDPELIEFLYRVPPRLLNRGGQQKGLVRHDIAARFPGLGFERQKKLRAREFVDEVLLTEAGIAWNELGGLQALGDLGIVDPGRLDTDVRGVLEQNDTRRLGDIWQLLRLESWVRPRV